MNETREWNDEEPVTKKELRLAIRQTGFALAYVIRQITNDNTEQLSKISSILQDFQSTCRKNQDIYMLETITAIGFAVREGPADYEKIYEDLVLPSSQIE